MELLEHLAQCCGGGGGGGDAAAGPPTGPPTGTATDAPRPVVVVVKSEKLVTEILKAEKPSPPPARHGADSSESGAPGAGSGSTAGSTSAGAGPGAPAEPPLPHMIPCGGDAGGWWGDLKASCTPLAAAWICRCAQPG
jgi:hypothetical protein